MMNLPITQQITFIYVKSLERSLMFYENIMGFSLWLDQGKCRIYQITTGGFLGICQTTNTDVVESKKNDIILTIVTPAVDEWYTYLQQQGLEFEKPPESNPNFKIYHCFVRDPDGYKLEIQRFLDNS